MNYKSFSCHLDEGCLIRLMLVTAVLIIIIPLLCVFAATTAAASLEPLHGLGRGPECLLVTPQVDMAPLPKPLLVEVQGRGMQLRQKCIPIAELFSKYLPCRRGR